MSMPPDYNMMAEMLGNYLHRKGSALLGNLLQTQNEIFSFVIIDVHCELGFRLALGSLYVGRDDVVGFTRRHPLSKLALVIGHEFPFWLLLIGAANLDFHAICREIVRAIDGAK
jgi:hypothetical protein